MAANPWDNDPIIGQGAGPNPWDNDPIVGQEKEEGDGFWRQAADIPILLGKSAVMGTRLASDAFGASNQFSDKLQGMEDYLSQLTSAQSKQDAAKMAEIMREAEGKGLGAELWAAAKSVGVAPLDFAANMAGTAVPVIVAGALTGGAGSIAVGSAMGLGTVKNAIYEATKGELIKQNVPIEVAEAAAQEAQAYDGENLDGILLGGALGVWASKSGMEPIITRMIAGKTSEKLAKMGLGKRIATVAAAEAIPEGVQGAQERLASNVALRRQGVPMPTWQGVAGQGAQEAIGGLMMGVGVGAMSGSKPAAPPPITPPGTSMTAPPGRPPIVPPGRPPVRKASVAEKKPPFYSAFVNTVLDGAGGMPKKGTAADYRKWFDGQQNRGMFKAEEREWTGLDEWLDKQTGPIYKEAVELFALENEVQVDEIPLGNTGNKISLKEAQALAAQGKPVYARRKTDGGTHDVTANGNGIPPYYIQHADEVDFVSAPTEPTKFNRPGLLTPGGENYRELLLTLPIDSKKVGPIDTTGWTAESTYGPDDEEAWLVRDDEGDLIDIVEADTEDQAIAFGADIRAGELAERDEAFRSGHWGRIPNVLAHIRFNERIVPDEKGGKQRVLFLEEIQSDWHQKARANRTKEIQRLVKENNITKQEAAKLVPSDFGYSKPQALRKQGVDKVANAPFKKTWPMLAMKRMIRYAAENGFDKVAWTTGEQQSNRYDLSKHIEEIEYTPLLDGGGYSLQVKYKEGTLPDWHDPTQEMYVENDELIDHVGEEIADKIIKGEGKPMPYKGPVSGEMVAEAQGIPREEVDAWWRNMTPTERSETIKNYRENLKSDARKLENLDLKVGGEGMKGFYDEMLVTETNKLIKKWGGKVGQTKVKTSTQPEYQTNTLWEVTDANGDVAFSYDQANGEELANRQKDSLEKQITNLSMLSPQQAAQYAAMPGYVLPLRINKRQVNNETTPYDTSVHSIDITPAMREAVMGGQPRFSKAQDKGSITVDRLKAALNKVLSLKHAAMVNVVQSVDQIPNHENMQEIGNYEGFYDDATKQVWLIADNIASEARGQWVAWHELYHRGVQVRFGKMLTDALALADKNGTIHKLTNAIMKDRGMSESEREIAVEEALAELNAAQRTGDYAGIEERYGVNVPASMQAGWRAALSRFMQTVRDVLSKVLGMPMDKVSDAEIWALIQGTDTAVSNDAKAIQDIKKKTNGELNVPKKVLKRERQLRREDAKKRVELRKVLTKAYESGRGRTGFSEEAEAEPTEWVEEEFTLRGLDFEEYYAVLKAVVEEQDLEAVSKLEQMITDYVDAGEFTEEELNDIEEVLSGKGKPPPSTARLTRSAIDQVNEIIANIAKTKGLDARDRKNLSDMLDLATDETTDDAKAGDMIAQFFNSIVGNDKVLKEDLRTAFKILVAIKAQPVASVERPPIDMKKYGKFVKLLESRLKKLGGKEFRLSLMKHIENAAETYNGELLHGIRPYRGKEDSNLVAYDKDGLFVYAPDDTEPAGRFNAAIGRIFIAIDQHFGVGVTEEEGIRMFMATLNHEIVHAFRSIDLFTQKEWDVLKNAAKNTKRKGRLNDGKQTYYEWAVATYSKLSEERIIEESIAEFISGESDITKGTVTGLPRHLINRIKAFIIALRDSLRGAGYKSYESILHDFESGAIGKRRRGVIRTLKNTQASGIVDQDAAVYASDPNIAKQLSTLEKMLKETFGTTLNDLAGYQPPYAQARILHETIDKLAEDFNIVAPNEEMASTESIVAIKSRTSDLINLYEATADKIGINLKDTARNLLDSVDLSAFHGSGAIFERFMTDHIGEGEGTQTAGWGLYFGEEKKTGEHYRKMLGGKGGALYEVEIPDSIVDTMLDLDKPLFEQSRKIQNIANEVGLDLEVTGEDLRQHIEKLIEAQGMTDTGEAIVDASGRDMSIAKATSMFLLDRGVHGNKFLDRWSRDGKSAQPTRNLVVFDENDIEIVSRNGIPIKKSRRMGSVAPNLAAARKKIGRGTKWHDKYTAILRDPVAWWHQNMLYLNQGMFDRYSGIKEALETVGVNVPASVNGYISARLSTSVQDRLAVLLKHHRLKWENGVLVPMTDTEGFLKILEPISDKIQEFGEYLVGLRARDLARENKITGFTFDEINAMLQHGIDNPEFDEIQQKYMAFNKSVLDIAVGAGVLDGTTRQMWEHDNYIPFYRVMDEGSVGPKTKRTLAGQTSPLKKYHGSLKSIGDPIENIMMNWAHLLDTSVKNKAALDTVNNLEGSGLMTKQPWNLRKRMIPAESARQDIERALSEAGMDTDVADMLSSAPTLNGIRYLWSIEAPQAPDVIRVMRNGKPEYYKVHDDLLLRSLMAVNAQPWGNRMNWLRWPKRVLTAMVTADPAFMLRNFLRDTFGSFVLARDKMTPGIAAVRGFAKAYRESPDMVRFMAAGGSFSTGGYLNASDPGALKRFVMAEVRHRSLNKTILNSPKRLWDFWQHLGATVENSNRVGVGLAGLKAGRDIAAASYEMKDIMDFSMRGDWPWIQFLSETVPFFSARLQGMQRLGRGAKEHPGAFLMKGALITFAAIALHMSNREDKRYKRLEEWEKDTYFHFWLGDDHYMLPKPFEVGVIFGTFPERMVEAMISEDAGAKQVFERIVWNLTQTLMIEPIPQLAKPILEQWANKSFFTGRAIVGERLNKMAAEAEYEPWTSDTMKELGNALGISPQRAEALIRGYFGTVGTYILAGADIVTRQLYDYPERPSMRLEDMPVISALYKGSSEPRNTKYTTEFYEMSKEISELYTAISAYRKAGEYDKAKEMQAENRDKLKYRSAVQSRQMGIANINAQMRRIHYNQKMSGDEKDKRLEALLKRRNDITEKAVDQFGEAFK